eukprot:NODE_4383_length_797_cov_15.101493_g4225_i0.p1 GENE.NODE_4383_length_797_cov_15.101493_g4225_i0~~NODE_4383_length_797_cov_15.101493_g4225_i0.p1  ORF type:complete len:253 (-),score=80.57 NODE_4383_length_797_cov_15.101493_g4225_i0:39-725(-)
MKSKGSKKKQPKTFLKISTSTKPGKLKATRLAKSIAKKNKVVRDRKKRKQIRPPKSHCWNCRGPGHSALECTEPCSFCGNSGHLRRYCPNRDEPCSFCGKTGHGVPRCPAKAQLGKPKRSPEEQLAFRTKKIAELRDYLSRASANRGKFFKRDIRNATRQLASLEREAKNPRPTEEPQETSDTAAPSHTPTAAATPHTIADLAKLGKSLKPRKILRVKRTPIDPTDAE